MTGPKADELDRLADHVLGHGLGTATLRPLAKAAGTSDRMLIYRYGSKDTLIEAVLDRLAARLTGMLEASPPPAAKDPRALAAELAGRLSAPALAPYRAVWLEVIAGASRADAAHVAAAARILQHFHDWLHRHLHDGTANADSAAAHALMLIEGSLLLGVAGPTGEMLVKRALQPNVG